MRHHVTRILPYTPDQLFDLVGDVERYPEFVPWITRIDASRPRTERDGITSLDAQAWVGFSFLRERFATRVRRDANQREITVELISGPFRKLWNMWLFSPDEGGCKVVFDIDFEFKSKLLDIMLTANFERAVARLIACFQARAETLYGIPRLAAAPAHGRAVSDDAGSWD